MAIRGVHLTQVKHKETKIHSFASSRSGGARGQRKEGRERGEYAHLSVCAHIEGPPQSWCVEFDVVISHVPVFASVWGRRTCTRVLPYGDLMLIRLYLGF